MNMRKGHRWDPDKTTASDLAAMQKATDEEEAAEQKRRKEENDRLVAERLANQKNQQGGSS